MNESVRVACVQAEPVIFDREATIAKLAELTREAAGAGAKLALFPETFVPAYPSNRWARELAHGSDGAALWARLAQQSIEVPGPAADALGEAARETRLWLAVGVNELERGTLYNTLLVYAPDGSLALHHRKLVPTNHERLVWGQGDGKGLETLTARELQVARLVVDRKTNPEIASELFLSNKTVESHLRNIFRKMDVASRVQLARAVERSTPAASGQQQP